MIFDPDLGLVLVKTVKVAGSSVETVLRPHLGPRALITPISRAVGSRGYRVPVSRGRDLLAGIAILAANKPWKLLPLFADLAVRGVASEDYGVPRLVRLTQHATATEIKRVIGEDRWRDSLKISLCRHPYDRAISRFYWDYTHARLPPPPPEAFSYWIRLNPSVLLENERIIWKGTTDSSNWRSTVPGEPPATEIDHFLRYESLVEDVGVIADKLGLAGRDVSAKLYHLRLLPSSRPTGFTQSELLERDRSLIFDLARPEFDRFHYSA